MASRSRRCRFFAKAVSAALCLHLPFTDTPTFPPPSSVTTLFCDIRRGFPTEALPTCPSPSQNAHTRTHGSPTVRTSFDFTFLSGLRELRVMCALMRACVKSLSNVLPFEFLGRLYARVFTSRRGYAHTRAYRRDRSGL